MGNRKRDPSQALRNTTIAFVFLLILIFILNEIPALQPTSQELILFGIVFLVYLILSGVVSEIAFGSFSLIFRRVSGETIGPGKFGETRVLELIDFSPSAAKGGANELSNIVNRFVNERITTLSLTEGKVYRSQTLRQYLAALQNIPYFRDVIFVDQRQRFQGWIDRRKLARFLRIDSQLDNMNEWLETWDLTRIPMLVNVSVSTNSTVGQTLRKMKTESAKVLPVIDSRETFAGIVTRRDIIDYAVSELIIGKRSQI